MTNSPAYRKRTFPDFVDARRPSNPAARETCFSRDAKQVLVVVVNGRQLQTEVSITGW